MVSSCLTDDFSDSYLDFFDLELDFFIELLDFGGSSSGPGVAEGFFDFLDSVFFLLLDRVLGVLSSDSISYISDISSCPSYSASYFYSSKNWDKV